MLRFAARLIACVALAVGLTVTALPLYLRTSAGHRTVERLVTGILNERVPGTVSVGALSGRVIDGLHAEDVVVRNPAGELVGRAEWMSVRWRPLALLRRHREIDELVAYRPIVSLDRGRWRTLPSKRRPGGRSTTIVRIAALDGQLTVRGVTFENVSGSASLHSRSNLDVHGVSAHVGAAQLSAYGIVGWGQERPWVATRLAIRDPRHLSGNGDVFYTPGHMEGAIDELTLAAPVATQLVGGRGAVRVRGEVQGAPDRLVASASASQGARALRIRARIDGTHREAIVDGTLAGGPRPLGLHVYAHYAGGTLYVPSASVIVGRSRLEGRGSVRRESVRAELGLRLAPAEARWVALKTMTPIGAQLALDGPFSDLAVNGHARLGAARLSMSARVDAPGRRGHAAVVTDNLRPAQLFARAPEMTISTALTFDGRWVAHALVGDVRVARGRLTIAGRTFDRLDSAGGIRIARSGYAEIRRLQARWASRRGQPHIAARGQLRWSNERLALSGAMVTLAGSRVAGAATWLLGRAAGSSHISARADAMTLSPELIKQLFGRRSAQPWVGRASLDGAPEDFALHAQTTTALGALAVDAEVRSSGGEVQPSRVEARLGDSHLVGSVRFARGRLTAALDELVLAPALLHALWPALEPGWPLHARGTIDGPPAALELALRVDGGPSTTELRAQLSWPTRRFRLVGHVDALAIGVLQSRNQSHVRGTVELAGEGQLANGGVVGTLTLRNARGYMMTSPFYRGLADVRFDGRSAELERGHVEVPGAKIGARGHGAYGEGFNIGYGVVIVDAFALRHVSTALRLLIGLNGILPGRTIEGTLRRRPGEKVELSHRVLPIGLSQLKMLFRVLTGRTLPRGPDDD